MGTSGKNTGVGCRALLQGIVPTPGLISVPYIYLPWQVGSLPLAQPGKPMGIYECVYICVCVYMYPYADSVS